MIRAMAIGLLFLCLTSPLLAAPFEIRVVDDATGRGVPLVELETVSAIKLVTDSAGVVAFDEPGLLGEKVFFHVKSHGYEFHKDGFGMRGIALETKPGGKAEIKLKRLNIAERLYRITGQGIYADSLKLGRKPPLTHPAINGLVQGQDSTQAVAYKGKLRWFWGDTNRAAYPLGNFQMSGATSLLPADGGLTPDVGVDLTYFTNNEGFSRPMAPLQDPGVVWLDGFLVQKDSEGHERLVAHYSRRKGLSEQLEHGLMIYNDERDEFERHGKPLPADETWRHPRGQATFVEGKGGPYWYFCHYFATTRVRATLDDVLNPAAYEALTFVEAENGYAWTDSGPPIDQEAETKLVRRGKLDSQHARLQMRDSATDKPVKMHAGSLRWNAYRKKFVLIGSQLGGTSFLGETWYAESPDIAGPWTKAMKIVTHDKYSFYNPVHHAFFDEDGGRAIYFEGTYTHSFSGNNERTPRYDYNQIMYRLDLADERLKGAR